MVIKASISAGELIDKITILEIKKKFVKEKSGLSKVENELNILEKELTKINIKFAKQASKIKYYKKNLHVINRKLWETENKIRTFESKKTFGREFVREARRVYLLNDKRTNIKRLINELLGSKISEVKSYSKY
jgi:chromosome segregation ATPase